MRWLVVGLPFFLASCAQVLGLDDYTRAGSGDAETFDASSDAASSDAGGVDSGDERSEGDAAIDVAQDVVDAGCAGICATEAPMGWNGPLILWSAMGMSNVPSCPVDFPTKVLDGNASLMAPPASCGCTCGAPSGVVCTATVIRHTMMCNGSCGDLNLTTGTCVNATVCGGPWDLGAVTPSGGMCTATASKNLPMLTWGETARMCATVFKPTQSTCASQEVCVPNPPPPFQQQLCIMQPGDVACPTTAPYDVYTVKHVYYDMVSDTRDCTACTCDAPAGVSCKTPHIVTYDQQGCAGNKLDDFTTIPKMCQGVDGKTKSVQLTAMMSGGMCSPSASSPTGAATPQNPTTVCCVQ